MVVIRQFALINKVGTGNMGLLSLDAGDGSYRYAGANPNNYVCFGSNSEVCPEDNLYRIIGVFDNQVKLIKATPASSSLLGTDGDYSSGNDYYWNKGSYSTTWGESTLNTINLNINYLNNIGVSWRSKIDNHIWYVDYTIPMEFAIPKSIFAVDSFGMGIQSKVGLMYLSDYLYASPSENWLNVVYQSSDTINDNWMRFGLKRMDN